MVKKEALGDEHVAWFADLTNKDIATAGGKGASLAEMYNHKFPIPPGFVVTAQSYAYFIRATGVDKIISQTLSKLDIEDTAALAKASKKIREVIEAAEMPEELGEAVIEAYEILGTDHVSVSSKGSKATDILKKPKQEPLVAVRSSATTEDLADASFAGQQDSFLNVRGRDALIQRIKECFSSLFTARAIYYRQKKGFAHEKSYLAVVVQKMIDSEKSGVMFSQNPLADDGTVVIEAVWGLGEGIVSGKIVPDHYVLSREPLELRTVTVAEKKMEIVRDLKGSTEERKLTGEKAKAQVLSGYEIKRLAQYALQLEEHYGKPQDIEFALANGEIYIVQSRPVTTKAKKGSGEVSGTVLLSGLGASPGVSSGTVRIVHSLDELPKVQKGDVLVTTMTNPDMVVSMQRAAGIITDEGGITSHAAIISREMGIPAVVGTREATTKLKDGDLVTVDGFTGRIIEGKVEERKVEILPVVPTRTHIKVIVDIPEYAERAALAKTSGVGLVRMEGIIAGLGKHPIWYASKKKLRDYTGAVYDGLKKIARSFEEIWVRTSDVRSDEFVNLEGAPQTKESNPMLGNHGIRFSLQHPELLEAEFNALKEIADEFPKKVFGIMMPQIISAEEVRAAKKIAEKVGFSSNVRLGVMVETPAAVQIIDELCAEGISFISFGTNDLTQYTLALDRNNPELQSLYTELHPAVIRSIKHVIQVCRKHNVETSICGQAGSKEEMVKILLAEGIDSISVNADAAASVSKLVASLEQSIGAAPPVEETAMPMHKEESIAEKPQPIAHRNSATTEEEELILKALDDDYVPGIDRKDSEVPGLNDAIPAELERIQE